MAKKRRDVSEIQEGTAFGSPIKLYRRTIRLVRIMSDLADCSQAALLDRLVLAEAQRILPGAMEGLMRELGAGQSGSHATEAGQSRGK